MQLGKFLGGEGWFEVRIGRFQEGEHLCSLRFRDSMVTRFVTHDVAEAVFLADTVYVLTKRPMELKSSFRISFPRPRVHTLKHEREFFELQNRITRELDQ